jgi:hypothetical protein
MFLLGFLQYIFTSMDPLDSDLIIYEQSVYLSSNFNLPKVEQVMLRSDLIRILEY